jgi:predicted phosphodiesterase
MELNSVVMKILIIPDIHGRTFWKDAVEQYLKEPIEDKRIIFLGDYFDPYHDEGIKQKDAIDNFRKIVFFKKKTKDAKVILLMGNHDMHYYSDSFGRCSRYDYAKAPLIRKLLKMYEDLFSIAYEIKDNGKHFIFSHAGIQKNWVEEHLLYKPDDLHVVEYLNACFDNIKKDTIDNTKAVPDEQFVYALDVYSIYRGSLWGKHGSIVWADALEYFNKDTETYGDFQIFGHTRLKAPYVSGCFNFACLDCSEAFILEDGVIKHMDGTPVKITAEKP